MTHRAVAVLVVGCLLPGAGGADEDPYANAPAYMRSLSPATRLEPIATVGQRLGADGFRLVGVLDGLGLYPQTPGAPDSERWTLLVNHEFSQKSGGRAGPLPSGARVTTLELAVRPGGRARLDVVSARWAIERMYAGEPPVLVESPRRGLAKLCAAFLADSRVGFDREIFLTGEESYGPDTFDGRGGLAIAICGDGAAYTFPRLGRAEWENVVVAPFTGHWTVVFGLEDGPDVGDGLHSQLYLYVGSKETAARDPLVANGLRNGSLYVLGSAGAGRNSEAVLRKRGESTPVRWVPMSWEATDVELDRAAKDAGAFGFVRIEDGACDPMHPGNFYFVTTGRDGSVNPRGRMYRLQFWADDPLAGGELTIVLDGREGVVSPDNIDVNRHGEIAIQEDPGRDLRRLDVRRDSSIWIYETKSKALRRVAVMNRQAAVLHALGADPANRNEAKDDGPGLWESSGIIDAESLLGRGAWLLTVQAHSLRIAPTEETVRGGQILWMQRR